MNSRRAWQRWWVHLLAGTMMVLGLLALTPAAPAAALCNGRSWFGDKHYCPATIEGVSATRYGTGRRVWLDHAFVSAVYASTDTLTFTQTRSMARPCPPGKYCGAGFTVYFVDLEVTWSGTHRPSLGDEVRLYGTTVTGSLVPAGYVKTGTCTKELVGMELCW